MADNYTPAPAPSKAEFNALSQQVDTLNGKIRTVNINLAINISLTSLLSGSSNEGSKDIVMFSCINNLATDMPQSANKYGTGILIDSGYYNSAYYFADDHKLYIGERAFSGSWSWYTVQMTAVS